jgi:Zn-dependent M28 family amino/carboxypeptidase
VFAVLAAMLVQPTFKRHAESSESVSPERLREHVYALAIDYAPRNYMERWNLDACAHYISDQFEKAGGRVSEHTFRPEGNASSIGQATNNTYRNVIASFGPETGSRIIVGAHYDAQGQTSGADDNASGVSGLIELAYLLGRAEPGRRVDLVAYTLGESPFFHTADMGSARHAAALKAEGADVAGMICLEMIGCFSDEPGSQRFPYRVMKFLYPDRANYIAVLGRYADRNLIRHMKAAMRSATDLQVHAMCVPRTFPELDLAGHLNFWENGYTAVMITDYAHYRDLGYHSAGDTADALDYTRMSKVVLGVYEAVLHMANESQ